MRKMMAVDEMVLDQMVLMSFYCHSLSGTQWKVNLNTIEKMKLIIER